MVTIESFSITSIALAVTSIILTLLLNYFKKSTVQTLEKKIKEEFYLFESRLELKSNLILRDETVRNNLLTHVAVSSINIKIKIWQDLYNTYFDYRKSWDFDRATPLNDFKEINSKLKIIQKSILINSIYLGGKLTILMSEFSTLLIDNIRKKYYNEKLVDNHTWAIEITQNEKRIDTILNEILQLLNSTLFTDQTLSAYEFTDEQLNKIFKIRENQLNQIHNE